MIKVITGNEAAAYGAMLCRPEVVCAYPITPQSRIPEQIAELCAQGLMKAKFVNVESETAALGYVIGASATGVRVFTATSSQGLALMHEQLHWAAGARLPIVMANVNRPLGAPMNVTCDQSDSLSQRDTGWLQFYCESVQEVLDTIIQAYKVSETVSLPSMVCLDGVYLSYLTESTEIPEQGKVDKYLPPYKPTTKITEWDYKWPWKIYDRYPSEPGGYSRQYYMGNRYELHKLQSRCVDAVLKANEEFKTLFGRDYPPVEEYKCEDADLVAVISGSAVGTGRQVIDKLREKGHQVGLVKLKMFRPFPLELVRNALGGRKKIAVIERDLSPGQGGIFHQEIKWALYGKRKGESPAMYGFIAGLGGGDITPDLIEKAILYTMKEEPPEQEVIWLGLEKKGASDEYDGNTIKI